MTALMASKVAYLDLKCGFDLSFEMLGKALRAAIKSLFMQPPK
jgi:hypothetical protein